MKLLTTAGIALLLVGLFVPVAGCAGLYLLTMELGWTLFELTREGR